MRTLVVTEFISLDGVVDSPGGGPHPHAGWTFTDVKPQVMAERKMHLGKEEVAVTPASAGGKLVLQVGKVGTAEGLHRAWTDWFIMPDKPALDKELPKTT